LLTQNHDNGTVKKYHEWAGGQWHYDEWFRLMIGVKRHPTDGWVKWYCNDQLLSEVYGVPTTFEDEVLVYPYFSNYVTWYHEANPEQTHDIVTYMDDIVVSTEYIPLDYMVSTP